MAKEVPGRPLKQYLGDAVYADFDGYHIVLTTEDGVSVSNRIALEPTVFRELKEYEQWVLSTLYEGKLSNNE